VGSAEGVAVAAGHVKLGAGKLDRYAAVEAKGALRCGGEVE
jgi:hypothetical protein